MDEPSLFTPSSPHPPRTPPSPHTHYHPPPPGPPSEAQISLCLSPRRSRRRRKRKRRRHLFVFCFFYCSMLLGTGGDQKLRLCVLAPQFCALLHGFRKKALCTTCDVSVKCRLDCRAVINVAFFSPRCSSFILWTHQHSGHGNRRVIIFFSSIPPPPFHVTDGGKAFVMLI